ncbi:MAG: ATP-binding protein [Acidobacteriota bacterium]
METPRSDGHPVILVAEDDAELLAAMVEVLQHDLSEVSVRSAADGNQAWAAVRHGEIDLLISDVVMPGMDGVELARRIRVTPEAAATYVILLTGIAPAEMLFGAVDEGADDCLLKPVRWEELVVRVRAGLRRVGAARRLSSRAQELERLYARQSDFLSMVSHEIRTPLSAILSSANILLRYGKDRPESVERFARVIHQEGQRLTRLINNLLDLAKIEAGQVEWKFAPIAVADLLGQVRESFSALAGERKLALEVIDASQGVAITADRDKLTQVLLNLLSNAIKHAPEGSAVRLRCLTRAAGGVRIEVEDEGEGIPAGYEDRIFERFQQLESGEDRGGTGLGLTISRQIVEHHGGRVWVEPDRPQGALFVMELPLRAPEEAGDGSV